MRMHRYSVSYKGYSMTELKELRKAYQEAQLAERVAYSVWLGEWTSEETYPSGGPRLASQGTTAAYMAATSVCVEASLRYHDAIQRDRDRSTLWTVIGILGTVGIIGAILFVMF
jgi:hypothetical protein